MRAWPRWGRISADHRADVYVRRIVNRSLDWRAGRWNAEVPTAVLPEPLVDGGADPEAHRVHGVEFATWRTTERRC